MGTVGDPCLSVITTGNRQDTGLSKNPLKFYSLRAFSVLCSNDQLLYAYNEHGFKKKKEQKKGTI